jgi:hypothetical protein
MLYIVPIPETTNYHKTPRTTWKDDWSQATTLRFPFLLNLEWVLFRITSCNKVASVAWDSCSYLPSSNFQLGHMVQSKIQALSSVLSVFLLLISLGLIKYDCRRCICDPSFTHTLPMLSWLFNVQFHSICVNLISFTHILTINIAFPAPILMELTNVQPPHLQMSYTEVLSRK